MSSVVPNRPIDPAGRPRPGFTTEPSLAPGHPADPLIATPGSAAAPTTVRNPTEARQAAPAGRVRYVLGFGILFVVIGFALVYLMTRP